MLQKRTWVAEVAILMSVAAVPLSATARGPSRPRTAPDDVARACAGVAELSAVPLRGETVESVAPFFQRTRSGMQLWGAVVTVRAGSGLTAEQLEQLLRCRIARCAVQRASDGCTPAVPGLRVLVQTAGARLAVYLWSDEVGAGREILARISAP